MNFSHFFIRRPIFAVMLIMALVVVGGVSYTKLGVDRFPNVDLPIISVRTILPGASPEEIESAAVPTEVAPWRMRRMVKSAAPAKPSK